MYMGCEMNNYFFAIFFSTFIILILNFEFKEYGMLTNSLIFAIPILFVLNILNYLLIKFFGVNLFKRKFFFN